MLTLVEGDIAGMELEESANRTTAVHVTVEEEPLIMSDQMTEACPSVSQVHLHHTHTYAQVGRYQLEY